MELKDYLRILRKYWMSIVALTLVGLALGALASILAKPTYTSKTALFMTIQSADNAGELAQGSSYTERQVKSFARVADSPIVLQPVVDALGLPGSAEGLAGRTTVSVPVNTSIIEIAVVDRDPHQAARIADEIGKNLIKAVATMAPKDSKGVATVAANTIEPPSVPSVPTSPKVANNLAIGLLVGLFLGLGQALLRNTLDRKVRTTDDVAQLTDVPVVGTVAFAGDAKEGEIVTVTDPQSPRAEDYRRLRTNLQFLGVGQRSHVLAVSSSLAGEGKTSTILNLAYSLAAMGKKTVLIDGDLRRPRVARRLKLESSVGLTTVLIGRARPEDVVQPVTENLDVMASGQIPPNPSELLASPEMAALVDELAKTYDHVLIDSAPLVPVTDTAVLSHLLGGVILVVSSGGVERAQVQRAIESVEQSGGKIVGIVVNKLKKADAAYGSQGYYHARYSDDEETSA